MNLAIMGLKPRVPQVDVFLKMALNFKMSSFLVMSPVQIHLYSGTEEGCW